MRPEDVLRIALDRAESRERDDARQALRDQGLLGFDPAKDSQFSRATRDEYGNLHVQFNGMHEHAGRKINEWIDQQMQDFINNTERGRKMRHDFNAAFDGAKHSEREAQAQFDALKSDAYRARQEELDMEERLRKFGIPMAGDGVVFQLNGEGPKERMVVHSSTLVQGRLQTVMVPREHWDRYDA